MTRLRSTLSFVALLALSGSMAGLLAMTRSPSPTGPPAMAPAAASTAADCSPVGWLQNVGYTLAPLGQGPAPARLGVSAGPTLFVVGGVPVSWVGKPVMVCPAADGYPRRVCFDGVCVKRVRPDAGKP